MASDFNKQLRIKLENNFKRAKLKVGEIRAPHFVIKEAIALSAAFKIDEFKMRTETRLRDYLIPEWIKYQSREDIAFYDCIHFEYNDQSVPPTEAYSYGMYNLDNFKSTIEPYYYKSADFNSWMAGAGLMLEPFSFCKPFHIEILDDEEIYENLHYEDEDSGVREIRFLAHAISKLVFNEVFANADKMGLFTELKLRTGGLFMYEVHDGGNVTDPFYLKN